MVKFGINTLLWSASCDESLFPTLDLIQKWGFDGVEVPILKADLPTYSLLGHRLDEIKLMGRTAVTICDAETNPASPDASIRKKAFDHLKQVIDCAGMLGATVLCGPFHSALGVFTGKGPTNDELRWSQEILSMAADHAQKAGIMLALEYLNRFECYLLTCAADTVQFCREVNHTHLKMMWDTFHSQIEEKSPRLALEQCSSQIVHVHISENDRSTPGEGQVRWQETFNALRAMDYNGWLTIEAFGQAMPDLAAATKIWRSMFPDETHVAKKGLQFMKMMIADAEPD